MSLHEHSYLCSIQVGFGCISFSTFLVNHLTRFPIIMACACGYDAYRAIAGALDMFRKNKTLTIKNCEIKVLLDVCFKTMSCAADASL